MHPVKSGISLTYKPKAPSSENKVGSMDYAG